MKRALKNVIESHKHNLKGADLRKAIMRRSDLLYADLRGADMRKVNREE